MKTKQRVILTIIFLIILNLSRHSFSLKQKQLLNTAVLDYVKKLSKMHQVPERYIAAIILTESGGDPDLIGVDGEIGLMQIYEPTFNDFNKRHNFNFSFEDLSAMPYNIFVGTLIFKEYWKKQNYDLFDGIMSYNVGTDLKPRNKAIAYLNKVLKNA